MEIETPPVCKPYDKPEGERRGLADLVFEDCWGQSPGAAEV